MPNEIDALVERLQVASGWSRPLDHDIAVLLYPSKYRASEHGQNRSSGHCMGLDEDGKPCATVSVPYYTSSIDAALTLVPEGWCWQVGPFNLSGLSSAQIAEPLADVRGFGPGIGVRAQSEHVSPAIALCIACLRARAQGGSE